MRVLAAIVLACASGATSAELRVSDWTPPARAPAAQPNVVAGADGALHATWVEADGKRHRLRHAVFADAGFATPHTIARGPHWFVNWADFPALVATRDGLWAYWLVRATDAPAAYGVRVAHSRDGARWSAPFVPHDDSATEHGFAAFWPETNGVGLAWLDGRAMAGAAPHAHASAMQLRALHLDAALAPSGESALDVRTCDCCQVDAAVATRGAVLAYRDRDEHETRDIVVRRRIAGEWQAPVPVFADGWTMPACPVNGPAIAARGDDVYVAWYTQAGGVSRVRLAHSPDGGARFEPPIDLAEGNALGRVDVAVAADGSVWSSWLTDDERVQRLMVARWDAALARGKGRVVAELPPGRSTGFPRMAVRDGDAYVVWTASGDDGKPTIAGARVTAR